MEAKQCKKIDDERVNKNKPGSMDLLKFFGKKWTLLILRNLKEHNKRRFNEILEDLDGISPKTLSERLKEFRSLNILEKEKFKEVPPRTEYRLTDKGRELIDCFRCMDKWMDKYNLEPEPN